MLHRVWMHPATVASDYARKHAAEVAALASQGLLTTRITGNIYGRVWRVTAKGLSQIQ